MSRTLMSLRTATLPACLALIVCTPGSAAVGPMPLAQLVGESKAIVIGEVDKTEIIMAEPQENGVGEARGQQIPRGMAWISVKTWIKGKSYDSVMRVQYQPALEDSPIFEVGQAMVLFLTTGSDGFYQTHGMSRGQFLIAGDRIAGLDRSLADFLEEIESHLD